MLDAAGITGHSHNFREEKVQFEEDEEGFDGKFHDSLQKLEPPLAEDIYKDRSRDRSKGAGSK